MISDLDEFIQKADVPSSTKLFIALTLRAISWLAWAFVCVGWFLRHDFLPYWFAIFVMMEGIFFFLLIFVLIRLLPRVPEGPSTEGQVSAPDGRANGLTQAALKGIVGNSAFYLFILALLLLLKAVGGFDKLFRLLVALAD